MTPNEREDHKQFSLPDPSQVPPSSPSVQSANVERIDKTLNVKDFYIMNEVEFNNKKGQRFKRTTMSGSNYTATSQDFLIGVTSLILAPSIGLPNPKLVGANKHYIVKDEVGGAGTTTITIRSEGEVTIDGASSSTITSNYGVKEFYSSDIAWFTK